MSRQMLTLRVAIGLGTALLIDLAAVSIAIGFPGPGGFAWYRIALIFWPVGFAIGGFVSTFPMDDPWKGCP